MRIKENWRGDLAWVFAVAGVLCLILVPPMTTIYQELNLSHPYIVAFLKFMIMAPLGELLALRITHNQWRKPAFFGTRVIIWGFLGVMIALAFQLFYNGVLVTAEKGMLPFGDSKWARAFYTSFLMNVWFAPSFMGLHRFSDTFLDLRAENGANPTLKEIVDRIDWHGFFSFVLLRTIPFFWIPAHTITFTLPGEYRVLIAAVLSIVLGLLLAIANKRKLKS